MVKSALAPEFVSANGNAFGRNNLSHIFEQIEALIAAAEAAQDFELSRGLKDSLASAVERYCTLQRELLEARISRV